MAAPFTLSQDGIELQFATNHIGMNLAPFFVLAYLVILANA